jgi:hypothetical protein
MSKDQRIDLFNLKAAMVLALQSTPDNPLAHWWEGVVKNMDGEDCIVLQVAKDFTADAVKVLRFYGLPHIEAVVGGTWNLLPIPVEYLTNCLPKRVTREWLKEEHIGPHDAWKEKVTARLDELGIGCLKMTYSGSGDSANDDEWECPRVGYDGFWYPEDWNSAEGRHWQGASSHTLPDDLQVLISEYVWGTLVQHDCVNNDGGGGHLEIDLSQDEPTFAFECYTNEMTSTTHDDYEV